MHANRSLAVAALVAAAGSSATPSRTLAQVQPGSITIELTEVAGGLAAPIMATHAGDGSGRLFIVDQTGRILILKNGAVLPVPFLDVSAQLPALSTSFDERGLLGLAFHPDYEANGRFFVRFSVPRPGAPGQPCFGTARGCHEEVLAEFHVSALNPNVADPTGTILFRVDEPEFNHNGGEVAFGPDGFLYFSLGDGGGAHDGLACTPNPCHGPIGNGQNINTTLGKVLRIDVDGGFPYAIPPSNPFANAPGADEIYAWGFRNPYRFSFDDGPGGAGTLYVADVGQALWEEVDIVTLGGNYGWVIREGAHCFDPTNPGTPLPACNTAGLIDPVAEYSHSDGISIIGGFVYRGGEHAELVGKYVFGDFSRAFAPPQGRLFYIDTAGTLSDIREFRLGRANPPLGMYVKGFGRDEAGEIYLCAGNNLAPTGASGRVFRIGTLCYPDCDADGQRNVNDVVCFQTKFALGDPYADCDANGVRDVNDYVCFQTRFAMGCP